MRSFWELPWTCPFEDPITFPDGRVLRTLQDAADYMMTLSAAKLKTERWQTAGGAVIMAAVDRGPLMHARIGMLKAINHDRPAEPVASRRKRARQYETVTSS
jgi:hypothetical protein